MKELSIGAVARITGLSEFTLRAWERRYELVQPLRRSSGRRAYSRTDVEKLRLLQKLTASGYAIGDIARLNALQLSELVHQEQGSAALAKGTGISFESARENVEEMLSAVRALNVTRLTALLKTRQMQHHARAFLMDVVALFLRELGEEVKRGALDIYHEHVASAVIRNYLSGILFATEQTAGASDEPAIVFATPEGDLHEFGILIAALLALMRSRPVLFLGSNVPFGSLERAARLTRAPMVVLGSSAPEETISDQDLVDYVKHLSRRLSDKTGIWIGGGRSHIFKNSRNNQTRLFSTFHEFDRALESLRG